MTLCTSLQVHVYYVTRFAYRRCSANAQLQRYTTHPWRARGPPQSLQISTKTHPLWFESFELPSGALRSKELCTPIKVLFSFLSTLSSQIYSVNGFHGARATFCPYPQLFVVFERTTKISASMYCSLETFDGLNVISLRQS